VRRRGPATIARIPYAVMVWVQWSPGENTREVVCHLKRLDDARAYVRRLTFAMARLTGGLRPRIAWYVRDERDGSEHHLSNLTRRETAHVNQDTQASRLW
jgi:hypothetical protein